MTATVPPRSDPSADAEAAVLGCLLWAGVEAATEFLVDLADEMVVDPLNATILGLVRALVDFGQAPAPGVVLAEARRTGMEAHRWGALGLRLAELYGDAPPASAGPWFLARLREEAARRRILQAGTRLTQVAESASIEDLADVVEAEMVGTRQAWLALQAGTLTGLRTAVLVVDGREALS